MDKERLVEEATEFFRKVLDLVEITTVMRAHHRDVVEGIDLTKLPTTRVCVEAKDRFRLHTVVIDPPSHTFSHTWSEEEIGMVCFALYYNDVRIEFFSSKHVPLVVYHLIGPLYVDMVLEAILTVHDNYDKLMNLLNKALKRSRENMKKVAKAVEVVKTFMTLAKLTVETLGFKP